MKARQSAAALLAILLTACTTWAQGVLVIVNHPHPIPLPRPRIRPEPSPPVSYRIKELTVQARVAEQVAQVNVSQKFVNNGSSAIQVQFVFPLPYDGAIDKLTFLVDGKEIEGKLLPADKARSVYEGYVRQNKDPALLEWLGNGMFQTRVFPVPAGAERQVTLQYSQLLRKNGKLVDFLFPLATAKYTSEPIEKVQVEVAIESKDKIKSVYAPNYPVNVQRSDEHHARVTWEASSTIPTTDFRLFYDTDPGELSASVVSYRPDKDEDGYFLLLASPEIKDASAKIVQKTVLFVLDRSGSMSGEKIKQARESLKFVLNNLREGDLFNIIVYDSNVESFRPELEKYNDQTRAQALGFVEGIYAGGSTNIDGALTRAFEMLKDKEQPAFVIFLSDGLPTAGETSEVKIAANARSKNQVNARLLSLGVGYDVNSRLLDRLVNENNGSSHYVRPDEDIEQHIAQLYSRISAPVMTSVSVKIDVEGATTEQGSATNRVYPDQVNDLFAGEQLVLVGRYKTPGDAKVVIEGKVGDKQQSFDFPAKLVEHSPDASFGFVEKLWAIRRIGEIIDEIDLHGKNDELVKELVDLSTRHGILTPYTSFLADENDSDGLANESRLLERTSEQLTQLDAETGRGGFSQRLEKQNFRRAQSLAPAPIAAGGAALPEGAVGGLGGAALGMRVRDIESDRVVVVDTVRTIGTQTLYKRGDIWIATSARDVDLEKDKEKIREIERFSDEYFRLITENTEAENALLAAQREGEQLLVRLRGQIYLVK